MITVSIDVSKLDESRLKQGNNGKGPYLEIVLFETQNDKFGNDFSVKQSLTKEEREQKVQLPFIGSGKNWSKGGFNQGNSQKTFSKPTQKKMFSKPAQDNFQDDDLPY